MSTLLAGVSRQNISPPPGIYLMGYGNRIQGNLGIHDDLYVTTLYLDDGRNHAALLSVDHTFIHSVVIDQVRQRLPQISFEALFVCCSHTHGGPIGYADAQSRVEDLNYIAFLVDQLVRSVVEAITNRQPVSLYSGESEAHININRRERTLAGKTIIGNNPAGPVDHSVQVVQVRSLQNVLLATLVNYACHPVVMGPLNRHVSADWVGAMRRDLETDTDTLCLFFQGATADVNPRKMRWTTDNWDEVEEQGAAVAAAVHRAASAMHLLKTDVLSARQATIWLPLMPSIGYNDQMRALLQQARTDDEIRAALHVGFPWHAPLQTWDGVLCSPIQIGILRTSDWAVVTLGTEPFTETGWALKAASPAKATFVAGYTNGCNSYLPAASAYAEGGYEVETAPQFYGLPSGFAQGGAEQIIREVQSLFA